MPLLGPVCLSSYLNQRGIKADFIDFNNQPSSLEESVSRLAEYKVAGFTCFKSNFKNVLLVANALRKKQKSIKIIFGGPEISRVFFLGKGKFSSEITKLADILVMGEGEKPLFEILSKKNIKSGLFFKNHQLENLEELPEFRYKGIDFNNYNSFGAIPFEFSRGCIRARNFCAERLLFKGYRIRPAEAVINEIAFYRKYKGLKRAVFFDSMLNADIRLFEKLCDALIRQFGGFPWEAQIAIRPDMEIKLLKKMKSSGCYNLFIGLESGSDNTLKKMRKGFTAREASNFFEKLSQTGLHFGVSMIVNYPGETEEDFKESLDFLIRNKEFIPKIEQVNPFAYYEGTNLSENYDYREDSNGIRRFEEFKSVIKKHGFKYTNAFLGNLIEK